MMDRAVRRNVFIAFATIVITMLTFQNVGDTEIDTEAPSLHNNNSRHRPPAQSTSLPVRQTAARGDNTWIANCARYGAAQTIAHQCFIKENKGSVSEILESRRGMFAQPTAKYYLTRDVHEQLPVTFSSLLHPVSNLSAYGFSFEGIAPSMDRRAGICGDFLISAHGHGHLWNKTEWTAFSILPAAAVWGWFGVSCPVSNASFAIVSTPSSWPSISSFSPVDKQVGKVSSDPTSSNPERKLGPLIRTHAGCSDLGPIPSERVREPHPAEFVEEGKQGIPFLLPPWWRSKRRLAQAVVMLPLCLSVKCRLGGLYHWVVEHLAPLAALKDLWFSEPPSTTEEAQNITVIIVPDIFLNSPEVTESQRELLVQVLGVPESRIADPSWMVTNNPQWYASSLLRKRTSLGEDSSADQNNMSAAPFWAQTLGEYSPSKKYLPPLRSFGAVVTDWAAFANSRCFRVDPVALQWLRRLSREHSLAVNKKRTFLLRRKGALGSKPRHMHILFASRRHYSEDFAVWREPANFLAVMVSLLRICAFFNATVTPLLGSIPRQIEMLDEDAFAVIGVHGANLLLPALFSRNNVTLIELRPEGASRCYERICRATSVPYIGVQSAANPQALNGQPVGKLGRINTPGVENVFSAGSLGLLQYETNITHFMESVLHAIHVNSMANDGRHKVTITDVGGVPTEDEVNLQSASVDAFLRRLTGTADQHQETAIFKSSVGSPESPLLEAQRRAANSRALKHALELAEGRN